MHIGQFATIADRRLSFCRGAAPEPRQTIAEYADAIIKLPASASEPDQWRTSRTPFLKEIMECLGPRHPCHDVIIQKPAQIGLTTTAIIWACFTMDRSPTNMLLFEPDIDLARNVVKDKLDPIIEATPALWNKVKRSRSRASGSTTFRKEFLGGALKIKWASSAAQLRMDSAERVILDEVDEYPHEVGKGDVKQGHPCDVVRSRVSTYPRYKIAELSTPTIEGISRIAKRYHDGSQGHYHVPCPHCGHYQHLVWERLRYTFDGVKRPADAAYQCESCEQLIEERYKTWMMDSVRAKWVHAYPERIRDIASFHINILYQPYGWADSWASLSREYIKANIQLKAGDQGPLKVFTNTKLALTWKEKIDKLEHQSLYDRREIYEAEVPRGVLFLTAAVDVQDNRLEAEIVGWGNGEESWSIAYAIISGSPSLPKVWVELTDFLQKKFTHCSGMPMRVEAVGVDTGGHHTKEAYLFVEKYRGEIFAFKGSSEQGAPPIPKREPKKHRSYRLRLYLLGTIALKDTIFARLKLEAPGPGYLHFPLRDGYDQDYFEGLTSEVKKPKYKPHTHVIIGYGYEKHSTARNEPLDLKVYNLAVFMLFNPDLKKRAAKVEAYVPALPLQVEARQDREEQITPVEQPDKTPFIKRHQPNPRRRGGFVKGWR